MVPKRATRIAQTARCVLARLLLVSWHVPATGRTPATLSLAGLLWHHLARRGRRDNAEEKH